jgi:hypothetical protein
MVRRSWRTELKSARTEEDVLDVVARFLGEWTRVEMALLPPGAWPSRVTTRADVLSHAAVLGGLHSRFAGPVATLPGLQELLLFFTHAAVRVARLTALRDQADGASAMRKPVVGRRRPDASRAARALTPFCGSG